ncbi:MAG: PEP-CTERM sorting domain-containing protein [Akkermansiaceae bacterium]|nr:PEP-CTERM sorting domain-containing protein [Akkermansiaceae bacterium]
MKFLKWGSCVILMNAGASAATLTGTVVTNAPNASNTQLDAGSVLNWAAWNTTSATGVASVVATNTLPGGPGAGAPGYISSITAATTGNVRGAGSAVHNYSWTGRSAAPIGYVLDENLATVGEGVKFTVTGGTALLADEFYRVNIWATGFRGTGELQASLNGATSLTLDSRVFGDTSGARPATLFQLDFRPDNASDLLEISFILKSLGATSGSAHVGIQAVNVQIIPEPSSLVLSAVFGGLALARRRRR